MIAAWISVTDLIAQEFWPVVLIVGFGFCYLACFLVIEVLRHWRWRRQVKGGDLLNIDRYSTGNRPGTYRSLSEGRKDRVAGGNRRELD